MKIGYDEDGEMESWDDSCIDCGQWRDWTKDECETTKGDDDTMTKPMDLDLDALEAQVAKLSPGPWLIDERSTPETNAHWGILCRSLTDEERKDMHDREVAWHIARGQVPTEDDGETPLACMLTNDCASVDDLRFMAEARQAVPALIAEVRRLRGLL